MTEIASAVRSMIAEVCAIDAEIIEPERPLIEYGMDSARVIDLIVGLEEAFAIAIPDEAATTMRTLADVTNYIAVRTGK